MKIQWPNDDSGTEVAVLPVASGGPQYQEKKQRLSTRIMIDLV